MNTPDGFDELTLVDVPDGPGGSWAGVWRDPYGEHWVGLPDRSAVAVHKYGPDWVTREGYHPTTIFAADGRMVRPGNDPIFIEEIDVSLETEIVSIVEGSLKVGTRVPVEDVARYNIAKRRLGDVAGHG